MGILDSMKGALSTATNAMTGGGATVGLEFAGDLVVGAPLKVTVTAVSTGAEVKAAGVFIDLRGRGKGSVAQAFGNVFAVAEHSFQIADAVTLAPNERRSFEAEVRVPPHLQHDLDWEVRARLDVSGNDPDSGFKDIRLAGSPAGDVAEDPRKLVVLAFNSLGLAQEALLASTRLMAEGKVVLHDAVFVTKEVDGETHVVEMVDETPRQAALSGAFWGLFFGTLVAGPIGAVVGGTFSAGTRALAAKLIDTGISDATIKELREAIEVGSTALAVLVSHVHEPAIVAEARRFPGARIVTSTLPEATIRAVQEALQAPPPAA